MNKQTCCPGSEIIQLIENLGKKIKRVHSKIFKEVSITPPQYFILHLLWKKDGRPFNELASISCCSKATITGVVDTMEKNGLVERVQNPEDRRSLLLKLTDKGQVLISSAPTPERVFNSCCAEIKPNELEKLAALLQKLDRTLDKIEHTPTTERGSS